ncbi:hypothetical protein SNE40_013685 [Patella caerulea]|uniref:Uncharacterized protein n=1 Tax=Patella caerulea TaxID=87958 RepID=A0AAN8JFI7_PATCE
MFGCCHQGFDTNTGFENEDVCCSPTSGIMMSIVAGCIVLFLGLVASCFGCNCRELCKATPKKTTDETTSETANKTTSNTTTKTSDISNNNSLAVVTATNEGFSNSPVRQPKKKSTRAVPKHHLGYHTPQIPGCPLPSDSTVSKQTGQPPIKSRDGVWHSNKTSGKPK